jgi:hypothetical protein
MNSQHFKFNSFEEFLEYLPASEKKMVFELQALIEECVPGAKLKLSYNVPFYSLKKRLCFIWPSSVPWGKVKLKGVQLGFCQGYLLHDPNEFLDRGDRKQVYSKTYFKISEIEKDREWIRHFLFEAVEVDRADLR